MQDTYYDDDRFLELALEKEVYGNWTQDKHLFLITAFTSPGLYLSIRKPSPNWDPYFYPHWQSRVPYKVLVPDYRGEKLRFLETLIKHKYMNSLEMYELVDKVLDKELFGGVINTNTSTILVSSPNGIYLTSSNYWTDNFFSIGATAVLLSYCGELKLKYLRRLLSISDLRKANQTAYLKTPTARPITR